MSGFRSQIEGMINEKLGTNQNRNITGTITKVYKSKENGASVTKCTVCPVDIDMIWEMKNYYKRTKIDRNSAQNLIEAVTINAESGLKLSTFNVGDKVSVGYNDDRPYVIQRISSSFSMKNNVRSSEENAINMKKWIDTSDSETDGEYNPIPSE